MKCFLLMFQQFRWLEMMLPDVKRLGLEPVIVDNNSTHEETVEWLKKQTCEVRQVGFNCGNHGFWDRDYPELTGRVPYVMTDSDLDLSNVPDDAVAKLQDVLLRHTDVPKVGLSLSLASLSEDKHDLVHTWEDRYWVNLREPGVWEAPVDTTFAMYDPTRRHMLVDNFYTALRLDKPYTAIHIPWSYNFDEASPDVKAYIRDCLPVAYWSSLEKRRHG